MFVQNFFKPKLRAMSLAHHLTCPTKSWSSAVTAYRRLHNFRNAAFSSPQFYQRNSGYGRFAYDEFASEESDGESQSSSKQLCASTLDNVEEWQWKLTTLMRRKDEQEIFSREKKDRRDFEQLSALATRMGLHCRQYDRVVVFSKVPLPNYRSDLDSKRPQREVVLPFGLQREVNSHLRAHLSRKTVSKENNAHSPSNVGQGQLIDEGFEEQVDTSTRSVIAERVLLRRSLQMRNKQQDWQESPEGQKMLDFRKSLPSHKERETLLHAISQNQVLDCEIVYFCGSSVVLYTCFD
ncbi:RNA helicase family protein [Perilla frutescens var. frutescens]|nr:RNA helicase family protein [Perilla frutescens var. frutescens]